MYTDRQILPLTFRVDFAMGPLGKAMAPLK
jgi:hypothetical protein